MAGLSHISYSTNQAVSIKPLNTHDEPRFQTVFNDGVCRLSSTWFDDIGRRSMLMVITMLCRYRILAKADKEVFQWADLNHG